MKRISDLIDEHILSIAFSNSRKRRKFLRDVMNYDKIVDDYNESSEEDESTDESENEEESDEESDEDESDENESDEDEEYETMDESEEEEKAKTQWKPSIYNEFVKVELPKLKIKYPDIDHKERFKMVAEMWKSSNKNPKKIINRT